ncbi:MAG: hypothetical protein ACK5JR_13490, partial [Tropicimonas sp.]
THKLVHFQGAEYGQLYDLSADPGEKVNLWDTPEAQDEKRALLDVMLNWHVDSTLHTRNARRLIVSPPGEAAWQ